MKRITYIDLFRGFGILFMIMGHIGFGGIFKHFIHAFHMPMFFFISGYFYKKDNISFSSLLLKKGKTLLIPYFSFGLIYFFILFINSKSLNTLYHLMFINTEGLPIAGALWFLVAIFFVGIFYYFLDKKLDEITMNIIIFIISIIGNTAIYLFPFRLPWALDASFVGLGIFHIARLMKKNSNFFNLNILKTIFLGISTTIAIFINGYINMREGTYAFIPLFWINAIASSIFGFNICRIIEEKNILKKIVKTIEHIGRNSIIYLCLNQAVSKTVSRIFQCLNIPIILLKITVLFVSLIILWYCDKLINHTKLKVLIGK